METLSAYRKLEGEILGHRLEVGRRPKFEVLIEDDQTVRQPKLVVAKTVVTGILPEGVAMRHTRSGLVVVSYDCISLRKIVPVLQPNDPNKDAFIPLEGLVDPLGFRRSYLLATGSVKNTIRIQLDVTDGMDKWIV